MLIRFFFLFSSVSCYAILTGNPLEPGLMQMGVWGKHPSWWSIRIGYFDDWVYKQRFQDYTENEASAQTFLQLPTYSSKVALNFKNRLDIYGLLGSSSLQLDEGLYSKQALSWGVGSRLILFKHHNFCIGTDFKYFETTQKPRFFVLDHLPYNITSNYHLKYKEWQGSLGMAYRASIFVPYLNATYIKAQIDSLPERVFVRFPDVDELGLITTDSVVNQKKWGAAMGFSWVDGCKASLSFEWRVLNQNAINVFGELRF